MKNKKMLVLAIIAGALALLFFSPIGAVIASTVTPSLTWTPVTPNPSPTFEPGGPSSTPVPPTQSSLLGCPDWSGIGTPDINLIDPAWLGQCGRCIFTSTPTETITPTITPVQPTATWVCPTGLSGGNCSGTATSISNTQTAAPTMVRTETPTLTATATVFITPTPSIRSVYFDSWISGGYSTCNILLQTCNLSSGDYFTEVFFSSKPSGILNVTAHTTGNNNYFQVVGYDDLGGTIWASGIWGTVTEGTYGYNFTLSGGRYLDHLYITSEGTVDIEVTATLELGLSTPTPTISPTPTPTLCPVVDQNESSIVNDTNMVGVEKLFKLDNYWWYESDNTTNYVYNVDIIYQVWTRKIKLIGAIGDLAGPAFGDLTISFIDDSGVTINSCTINSVVSPTVCSGPFTMTIGPACDSSTACYFTWEAPTVYKVQKIRFWATGLWYIKADYLEVDGCSYLFGDCAVPQVVDPSLPIVEFPNAVYTYQAPCIMLIPGINLPTSGLKSALSAFVNTDWIPDILWKSIRLCPTVVVLGEVRIMGTVIPVDWFVDLGLVLYGAGILYGATH